MQVKLRSEFVMQKPAAKWLMVASVIIALNASGWAEDLDAGKAEYLRVARHAMAAMERGRVRSALR
jgi:hypothetical protein